jgi:hypothetical protein
MATQPETINRIVHSDVRTLHAVEHIRRMRGGSQSHLMRCSDGNYYVVKFQNNPQHRRVLVNELLGTSLAACLGLPTTPIAVIDVREDLILLTPDLYIEMPLSRMPCQPGLQFGSSYIGDPHHLSMLDFASDKHILEANNLRDFAGMLVFDLWTSNTDSRQVIFRRPNAGAPHQAWMIDQGFCFNTGEWTLADTSRRSLYLPMAVYKQIVGIESFEPWLVLLESSLSERFLSDIASTIPAEWYEFDSAALRDLLERLNLRRYKVRELLYSMHEWSPKIFPNWVDCSSRLHKQKETKGEINYVAQTSSDTSAVLFPERSDSWEHAARTASKTPAHAPGRHHVRPGANKACGGGVTLSRPETRYT